MELTPQKREKTIIRTSFIGILANVLLVGAKAAIGFIAGSIAIVMDALNNLTDVFSSVITIIGTKLSNKKPDRKHPFGHGRIEYITATLVAILIFVAGITAIYQSINDIIEYFKTKEVPSFQLYQLIIIGLAILVKVGIGLFYRIQAKKVQSDVLKASGMDALWDAVLSTTTLVGAIFAYTLNWYVEGYLGILIGLFILRSGFEILTSSISEIIGKRYDPEEVKKIISDIDEVEGVRGAFDLILNSYGPNRNIGSVHVLVDANLTAKEIQVIERNVQTMMYIKHNTIMTVGIYADCVDSKESKAIMAFLSEHIIKNPNILQMHGFFVDNTAKVCNFDLVISFDEKEPEALVASIQKSLEEEYPDFRFIINLDRDYSLS